MRVLVTGGNGFLGSHVVDKFRQRGDEVLVAEHQVMDLTIPNSARAMMAWSNPDVVIHLAAEVGGIGANQANPGRYWYSNLMMGMNVLDASRIHKVKKLVMVGTVCSYPKNTETPFREEDIWEGYPEETNAPYGIAKKSLLVGAQAYRHQYGLNTIYLVPVNLYGPRDNFDLRNSHVIPAMIAKMLGEEPLVLWGDGSPTREFLYVEDCAEAIWRATKKYDGEDPVNLGSGEEISIRNLAWMIASETGFSGDVTWDLSKPNGQPRRSLDVSKAIELFGFKSKTSLAAGLKKTVHWFRYER